jgi:putative DeoR family transcriptional regulator, stage III sporulation protein D
LKGYIEERAIKMAEYIVETGQTVRQTAKTFGVSKSTVHTDVHKPNDLKQSLRLARKPVDREKS